MTSHYCITARLGKLAAQFPYFLQTLRLVREAAPRHAAASVALLIVQALVPAATVYLTRLLVDALVACVRSGGAAAELQSCIMLAAVMGLLLLAGEAAGIAAGWVRTAQSELVQDHISSLIHRKSVEADLAFYDNAEFYNHLHRARADAGYRPVALVDNLGGIARNGITLVSMLAVLIPYGPWLAAALLASTVPALIIFLRHAREQHRWRLRATPDERRAWYYDWLLTADEPAAEARLFDLGGLFQDRFQTLRSRLREERLQLAARHGVAELLAGLGALGTIGAAMAWMGWRAVRGDVTLGGLAMFYQAVQQGMRVSRSLLENVGQLYSNALFLGHLFEFLALEPEVVSPASAVALTPVTDAIRFRGVTFRYAGADRPALSGLNLEIPARRITAIVGSNGAGKSTLLKLLCRLYDPDEGSVELDGVDLRRFDLRELRRGTTVLFQRPVRYNATAAENIALGDCDSTPARDAVERAAAEAGAADIIRSLPGGYDHLLGRWFENGAELSAGEWQRIALARAFLRKSPILILDEPTSAMDPWAEADWLSRFRELAAGRTAIVITHRLTTAQIADHIHVLSAGHVVESGSHLELLAAGGRYREAWVAQTGEVEARRAGAH